jgi:hypothetical protein
MHSRKLFIFGFLGVLLGAVLPFLMVIGVVKASFFLSFLSYGASVAGLFMGVLGAATYVGESRRKRD